MGQVLRLDHRALHLARPAALADRLYRLLVRRLVLEVRHEMEGLLDLYRESQGWSAFHAAWTPDTT